MDSQEEWELFVYSSHLELPTKDVLRLGQRRRAEPWAEVLILLPIIYFPLRSFFHFGRPFLMEI